MSPDEFREFLESQKQQKASSEQINWQTKKDEWQEYAKKFMDQVKQYLTEFSGDITLEDKTVSLTEDNLGTYDISALSVQLPGQKIEFEPVGTNVIGASGRIDMKGSAGTVKWVLVPESYDKPRISVRANDEPANLPPKAAAEPENSAWKLATPPPHIRFVDMTKDTLLEAIMEVTHG